MPKGSIKKVTEIEETRITENKIEAVVAAYEVAEQHEMEERELPVGQYFLAQSALLEEWKRMQLIYNAALKEIGTKLEILNNEFQMAHSYNPIEHISSRIKSPESIAKKLRRKGCALTVENIVRYINDVAGIRITCSFTSDIYRIAELVAGQADIKVLKVKDYIENPKPNGYMSYHMIVSVPIFLSDTTIDTKVEIQIRTIAMDFWASLEHKIYYKFEGNAPENIRRELKECADLVGFLDRKMLAINEEIQKYSEPKPQAEVPISETLRSLYGRINEEKEIKERENTPKREQIYIEPSAEELKADPLSAAGEGCKAEEARRAEEAKKQEEKKPNKLFGGQTHIRTIGAVKA